MAGLRYLQQHVRREVADFLGGLLHGGWRRVAGRHGLSAAGEAELQREIGLQLQEAERRLLSCRRRGAVQQRGALPQLPRYLRGRPWHAEEKPSP